MPMNKSQHKNEENKVFFLVTKANSDQVISAQDLSLLSVFAVKFVALILGQSESLQL